MRKSFKIAGSSTLILVIGMATVSSAQNKVKPTQILQCISFRFFLHGREKGKIAEDIRGLV
jgi:hypothetical protein